MKKARKLYSLLIIFNFEVFMIEVINFYRLGVKQGRRATQGLVQYAYSTIKQLREQMLHQNAVLSFWLNGSRDTVCRCNKPVSIIAF